MCQMALSGLNRVNQSNSNVLVSLQNFRELWEFINNNMESMTEDDINTFEAKVSNKNCYCLLIKY